MIDRALWRVPFALAFFVVTPLAFGHAILVRSTPADQAIVHSHRVDLTLNYNARIDARRSSLTLTGPGEKTVPVQIERSNTPGELKAAAGNLANGTYRVHWQVLASDGHITRGDFAFTVDAN